MPFTFEQSVVPLCGLITANTLLKYFAFSSVDGDFTWIFLPPLHNGSICSPLTRVFGLFPPTLTYHRLVLCSTKVF